MLEKEFLKIDFRVLVVVMYFTVFRVHSTLLNKSIGALNGNVSNY